MKNAKKKQGFTLIELLITLVLVAMVGVLIAGFVTPQMNIYQASENKTGAKTICNGILNQASQDLLYAKNISVADATITYTAVSADGESPKTLEAAALNAGAYSGAEYTVETTFAPFTAATGNPGVTVTVVVRNADTNRELYSASKNISSMNK